MKHLKKFESFEVLFSIANYALAFYFLIKFIKGLLSNLANKKILSRNINILINLISLIKDNKVIKDFNKKNDIYSIVIYDNKLTSFINFNNNIDYVLIEYNIINVKTKINLDFNENKLNMSNNIDEIDVPISKSKIDKFKNLILNLKEQLDKPEKKLESISNDIKLYDLQYYNNKQYPLNSYGSYLKKEGIFVKAVKNMILDGYDKDKILKILIDEY